MTETTKKKVTSKKAAEPAKEITLADTLFKTEMMTLNPSIIQGITTKFNSYEIHTHHTKPLIATMGKEEDLKTLTDRWAEALFNTYLYEEAQMKARQEILTSTP